VLQLGRILGPVEHHLLFHRAEQVDIELVGQPHQVHQHIGHLVPHLAQFALAQLGLVALVQPLEMFEQFGRLHRQGRRQIFRRMKLVPVALVDELAHQRAQAQQLAHQTPSALA
jgi:hypothetical protein